MIALPFYIGWPVFGTLIAIDDDLPGGFSNPDGKATPEWKTMIWHIDILLCRGSVVVAAFAIQSHDDHSLASALAATCRISSD
jgi:hypothetical protein